CEGKQKKARRRGIQRGQSLQKIHAAGILDMLEMVQHGGRTAKNFFKPNWLTWKQPKPNWLGRTTNLLPIARLWNLSEAGTRSYSISLPMVMLSQISGV